MSLSFQVLGSSSSGNATLLICHTPAGERRLLIDAGLGPRTVARRLASVGLDADAIDGIVLTHADSDHMRPTWRRTLERRSLPVHVPLAHHREVVREAVPSTLARSFSGPFEPVAGVRLNPFLVPHDTHGSCAFRIECGHSSLGWATDLGRVPPGLLEHLEGVDALAIESNYDPLMQQNSERPAFLIRRITGGRGHLSNEQCLTAVQELASRQSLLNPLAHIVLLHLSRDCNCPALVTDLWEERAPELVEQLVISRHDEPGPMLRIGAGVPHRGQGALFS